VTSRHVLKPRRPRAVLNEVPAALQPLVASLAHDACVAALQPLPPACQALHPRFGAPDFYDALAQLNVVRASDWIEMARVQRQFHAAEVNFDVRTRAYSESMRLTLHGAVLWHLRAVTNPLADRHFFEQFLELHVTAFHENGAWLGNMHIAWCGALDVVGATRLSMLAHAKDLHDGQFTHDRGAVCAAEWVRQARRSALASAHRSGG
jgi:hypothetical protein